MRVVKTVRVNISHYIRTNQYRLFYLNRTLLMQILQLMSNSKFLEQMRKPGQYHNIKGFNICLCLNVVFCFRQSM